MKLNGSALVTDPASVARLASALNSVKVATASGCVGTGFAMILVGEGQKVAGLDVQVGDCPYLSAGENVASYAGTGLLQVVNADLAAGTTAGPG